MSLNVKEVPKGSTFVIRKGKEHIMYFFFVTKKSTTIINAQMRGNPRGIRKEAQVIEELLR